MPRGSILLLALLTISLAITDLHAQNLLQAVSELASKDDKMAKIAALDQVECDLFGQDCGTCSALLPDNSSVIRHDSVPHPSPAPSCLWRLQYDHPHCSIFDTVSSPSSACLSAGQGRTVSPGGSPVAPPPDNKAIALPPDSNSVARPPTRKPYKPIARPPDSTPSTPAPGSYEPVQSPISLTEPPLHLTPSLAPGQQTKGGGMHSLLVYSPMFTFILLLCSGMKP